jgi:hypothetical protein
MTAKLQDCHDANGLLAQTSMQGLGNFCNLGLREHDVPGE